MAYHETWCEIWTGEITCGCDPYFVLHNEIDQNPEHIPSALELNKIMRNKAGSSPDPIMSVPSIAQLNTYDSGTLLKGIQNVRNAHQKEKDELNRLLETTNAIVVDWFSYRTEISERDLVQEVISISGNPSEYLASYAVQNLVSKGLLKKDYTTGRLTLVE